MIVKCLFNKLNDLDSDSQNYLSEYIHLDQVDLEIGKSYVVYGIINRAGVPWYYICEEESDSYPKPHFSRFFQIENSTPSILWEHFTYVGDYNNSYLLPTSWGVDSSFYEKLVEGNPFEETEFQKIKQQINKEVIS